MNRHQNLVRLPCLALLIAAWLTLAGCSSTPRHTNTLIFGTNTVFGLNIAQESTASAGVIVGYKRQEAVWMPLLPNQAPNTAGEPVPATCKGARCPKFEGTWAGRVDTYSVLASFGARYQGTAGGATGVDGNGGIAQYFATGIAAQLLAQSGGASLVNTAAAEPLTASERAAGRAAVDLAEQQATQLINTKLLTADGKAIDMAKLDTLMTSAKLDAGSQAYLKAKAGVSPVALKEALLLSPNVMLLPLLN